MITFRFEKTNKKPLYEQLYMHLKRQIETGEIGPYEKLPSCRKLATHLDVSLSTVLSAYEQLQAEGYIESKPKYGYYAQEIGEALSEVSASIFVEEPDKENKKYLYDMDVNDVDIEHFPFSTWAKLSRSVLSAQDPELLKAMHPQGDIGLRVEITKYLKKYRGMDVSPAQVVLGAGTEFLIGVLAELLEEDNYAVEEPCYIKIPKILERKKCRIHPVPIDDNGIDINELEKTPANVAIVTPSHQFPLGTITGVKRRAELLAWAHKSESRYILEDDYDSDYRFNLKPIPSLQSMDKYGKVIYMNTFTKTLAPSFRIGYLVLPQNLVDEFNRKMYFNSCTVSSLEQHTLLKFMEGGYYERHLSRMRKVYKGRRDKIVKAFAPYKNVLHIDGKDAGLHLIISHKAGICEEKLFESAAEKGVKVYPLSSYYTNSYAQLGTSRNSQAVLLGYAGHTSDELDKICELLIEAWCLSG